MTINQRDPFPSGRASVYFSFDNLRPVASTLDTVGRAFAQGAYTYIIYNTTATESTFPEQFRFRKRTLYYIFILTIFFPIYFSYRGNETVLF